MGRAILSRDLIEQQLAQVDLLMAMFPGQDSVTLDEAASASLEAFKSLQNNSRFEIDELPPDISPSVAILLTLEVHAQATDSTKTFQLHITVPFCCYITHSHYDGDGGEPEPEPEPPYPGVRLLQPSWMSKAEAATLAADAPRDQDLFAVIAHFQEAAQTHLSSSAGSRTMDAACPPMEETPTLVRAWFYFPSISTRSKRNDMVKHAPGYDLTGFLLSGKPGVLCLEGAADGIDAYMSFIKTESWSDIPAHHKKVTERFREHRVTRVFEDMQEITDAHALGGRRGERANRGDMRLLEAWLVDKGLGDAFMKVLLT